MAEPSQAVGTTVLFENSVVRVWDFYLAPGQESDVHRHYSDYLIIYVTDDNNLEVRIPGQPPNPVSAPDGYVSFIRVGDGDDAGLTHSLANVGDKRHRQIVVELLGLPAGLQDGQAVIESSEAGSDAWADQRRA